MEKNKIIELKEIESLLTKKLKEREETNKEFSNKPFTCEVFERGYSEKMDKLEIEIDLLQTLLKIT